MLAFQSDIARLIEGKSDEEHVEASVALLRALVETPDERMMTTQQVADSLGVSRPFVVKLIESGDLPAQRVGTHRRVRAQDVAQWKTSNRQKRLQTLRELAALDAELEYEARAFGRERVVPGGLTQHLHAPRARASVCRALDTLDSRGMDAKRAGRASRLDVAGIGTDAATDGRERARCSG